MHSVVGPYEVETVTEVKRSEFRSKIGTTLQCESGSLFVAQRDDLYHWLAATDGWKQFRPTAVKFSHGTLLLVSLCEYGQFIRGTYRSLRDLNRKFKAGDRVILAICKIKAPIGEFEEPKRNIWDM